MKINRKLLPVATLLICVALLMYACQKSFNPLNNSSSPRNVALYLTDDPCQYDSVFIDLSYVEVKVDTTVQARNEGEGDHENDDQGDAEDDHQEDHHHFDKHGIWDTLSIRPGIYNILELRNGVDTLLATGTIPAGKIRKIRVTLGTKNSVVISGVSYTLNLFPHSNNYVYIKTHGEDEDDLFKPGQTSMWLDFNVCKSIRSFDGQYYLAPFLKLYAKSKTGRIEGKVLPSAASPYVTAYNATDTASALPGNEGEYKIGGLKPGSYSVLFKGSNGYKDTTINNVEVKSNHEMELRTITLHQ